MGNQTEGFGTGSSIAAYYLGMFSNGLLYTTTLLRFVVLLFHLRDHLLERYLLWH